MMTDQKSKHSIHIIIELHVKTDPQQNPTEPTH